MRLGRALLLGLHIVGLSIGLLLAIAAADSALVNAATDTPAVALSRSATASALILVQIAFCGLLVVRGFSMIAPFAFAISFGSVGMSVDMFSRAWAKGFAPASPDELPALYTTAIGVIAVASLVAVAAWVWTLRKSRFPLL